MIVQSDVVASNGVIHIISKLMDSVPPTVDSDPQVQFQLLKTTDEKLSLVVSVTNLKSSVFFQENLMKIISNYGKFDLFKSLLEVETERDDEGLCPAVVLLVQGKKMTCLTLTLFLCRKQTWRLPWTFLDPSLSSLPAARLLMG